MPYRWPGVWVTSRSVTVSEIFQSLIQTLLVHKEQHDLSSLDMKYPPHKDSWVQRLVLSWWGYWEVI